MTNILFTAYISIITNVIEGEKILWAFWFGFFGGELEWGHNIQLARGLTSFSIEQFDVTMLT